MARWRLQNPGNFPLPFHTAMRQGIGTHVIEQYHTKQAAKSAQERWQLFRFCLRGYSYPTSAFEPLFHRRTKVKYNHNSQRWELLVDVSPTAEDLIKNIKVVQNTLDSPGRLD